MCCNYTEMRRVLESDNSCPMCEKQIDPMAVTISNDPEAEFKALVELMRDSTNQKEDEGAGSEAEDN